MDNQVSKSYEKQIRKMMKKIKDKGTTYITYKETMIVEENNIKLLVKILVMRFN